MQLPVNKYLPNLMNQILPNFTESLQTLPKVYKPYQNVTAPYQNYWTLPNLTEPDLTLPSLTKSYQYLPNVIKTYRTLPSLTEPQRISSTTDTRMINPKSTK